VLQGSDTVAGPRLCHQRPRLDNKSAILWLVLYVDFWRYRTQKYLTYLLEALHTQIVSDLAGEPPGSSNFKNSDFAHSSRMLNNKQNVLERYPNLTGISCPITLNFVQRVPKSYAKVSSCLPTGEFVRAKYLTSYPNDHTRPQKYLS